MDFSPNRRRPPLVLELTPLIDVVFLLLIFFMVSTTFVKEPAGLKIDLPRSDNRDVIPEGTDISIELSADGRMFVEDQPVDDDALKARLAQVARDDPKTMIVLRADSSVQHGHVVHVMDLARDVGLRNFAIATDKNGGR